MAWHLLDEVTKQDRAWIRRKLEQKAKFLIDENLDHKLVEVLGRFGFKAITVSEAGLEGRSDEDIFSYAWRENLFIVTTDRGFLNNRRFPWHSNPGVLIIPGDPLDSDRVAHALRNLVYCVAPLAKGWKGSKIEFSGGDEFSVYTPEGKQRYKYTRNDEAYEWRNS